jgi:hypothetical protein
MHSIRDKSKNNTQMNQEKEWLFNGRNLSTSRKRARYHGQDLNWMEVITNQTE